MSSLFLSWNRLPNLRPVEIHSLDMPVLPKRISTSVFTVQGNARSYGDVCLTEKGVLLKTLGLNKFISFDRKNGILQCYAGTKLSDILALVVPHGWFLSTTPGTALITVGGAIANDVHGKNHHVAGTFGHHVNKMELLRSDGSRLILSPQENKELFTATVGGLGLTGLITWAEIQLMPIHNPLMWTENRSFRDLDEYWELNQAMQPLWPCSASWIDCLSSGRGVMFLGRHASAVEQPFPSVGHNWRVPFEMPLSLVNNLSVKVFNTLYYHKNRTNKTGLTGYKPFFYPLDGIYDWNRIYGYRGFYQYQCVFPPHSEKEGIRKLLAAINHSGQGSFLAVLKSFGDIPSIGMLSFPRAGTTLALDFPNKGDVTSRLFSRLDAIVNEYQGVLYPGKDARMPGSLFRSHYPQWEAFSAFIDSKFSSHFWERVTK